MTKAFLSNNGQMKLTIPKLIAEAMQLKHGSGLRFSFSDNSWQLILDNKQPTVKVFFSKSSQAKITIPKTIAEAMQLHHKTKLSFIFNGKNWLLKKNEQ